MKKTSLFFLIAGLLLSMWSAAPAVAQDGPRHRKAHPEQRVERHVRMLDRQLDLTDSQEAQVKELLQARQAESRAWHEANEDASREDKMAYRKQQKEATKAALGSVLTSEQQQQLEERIAQREDTPRMRKGRAVRTAMRSKARRARMADALDLTDAQREQLKALRTDQREANKAWRDANPNATREEKRAYRKQQAEANRSALENVLTADQRQQLEEMKAKAKANAKQRGRKGTRGLTGLDLTDAQKSQLKDLRASHRAEMKAWMEANPDATREEKKAYRKQQAEANRSVLQSILTPEQQQILQERREKRQERRGDKGGQGDTGSARLNGAETADTFALANYPNPFNPSTEIRFTLPEASQVSLVVYDVQGREVATLLDEQRGSGDHRVTFNAGDLPTGTYLYRLTAGASTQTGRMVLMK